MIRVLQCVVNMNRGGAETLLMNVYRNIDRDLFQFDFLTSYEGAYDEEINQLGGRIYRIPYVEHGNILNYKKHLKKFFLQHSDYRIVHAHMNEMNAMVLAAAKQAGVQWCISHSHAAAIEGNVAARCLKKMIGTSVNKNADVRLACSDEAGKHLYKGMSYTVINNGVNCAAFQYNEQARQRLRCAYGIDENETIILHVGRYSKPKNHAFLIDVFRAYQKINNDSRLFLLGSGELETEIRKYVSDLGLEESVVFLGSKSNVYEYTSMADLFLFPSLFEGLPLSVVEAQAAGLPCVISAHLSNEINITNLIHRISLDSSAEEWAVKLRTIGRTKNRERYAREIEEHGYGIDRLTNGFQEQYLLLCGEKANV